jgi:S-adenosylmethionine-diacylglycerol 3-amino-3-carboxypropyl transferase
MGSEVAGRADFSGVRYAQCWEDADILLDALDIQPGDSCLAIASAGDNVLAMLSRRPARVLAVDLSPAQLACLELRVVAYRMLSHPELLELIGSTPSSNRGELYGRCRPHLSPAARDFWDAHPGETAGGIGTAGRFERYFALFRTRVLPLVHRREAVSRLLQGGDRTEREAFYHDEWDTWRWRLLFHVFFSRFVMGRLGRDPSFFRYVEGSVADRILGRTRHAVTELNPAENPYLQWILTGRHTSALPFALRPENFELIRDHLDRLEWRCQSIEDALDGEQGRPIDRYNLSDIFEYMSADNYERLLTKLVDRGRRGGRLVYWNMLVPRSRPPSLAGRLQPRPDVAALLYAQDKAFFYSALVVEEVL